MAKESNFKNLTLTLFLITLLSSLGLGVMYTVTKEPVEQAKEAKVINALKQVLPEFDNKPNEDITHDSVMGSELLVYHASLKGEPVGIVVKSVSDKGFSGNVVIMVGFDMGGNIVGYSVLDQKETPGLGTKMVDWFKPQTKAEPSLVERIFGFTVKVPERKSSIIGLNAENANLTVSKDGGDVDAITAATISSRAFLDAVSKAHIAFKNSIAATTQASQQTTVKEEGVSNE